MVYFLTFVSAVMSIIGNVTGKYWADAHGAIWMALMLVSFTASSVAYAYSLRYGHFTTINALFYAVVPIITALFGFFLFKDKLTTLQLIGLVLGIVGIVFMTIEGKIEIPEIR